MARPRRPRLRRPPPPDPYRLDPVIEERVVEERGPRRVVESPWLWLALLAIGVAAAAIVLVAVIAARDDEPDPRPRARPPVSVPLAVGSDYADASTAIEELGLVADTFPVSSGQPAGRVLDQSPAAGTRLRRGERVRLNVSLGPAPLPMTPVPDVTGPPAAAARAELRRAGFTVRTIFDDAPSPREVGDVVGQHPEARALAPALTQVTIVVGT
jgi:hypothetical protein